MTCARRYAYRYVLHLVPKVEDEPFTMGTAIHAGAAVHYRGESNPAEEAARVYLKKRAEWYGFLLDEWKEAAGYVAKLINCYIKRETPIDDFDVLEVETSFGVPLLEACHNCSADLDDDIRRCSRCGAAIWYWAGTVDLDVLHEDHRAIIDHKSTKYTPDDGFLDGFAHSFQLLGYVFGRMKQTGETIYEFAVNAMQKAKTLGEPQATLKQCPSCHNGKKKKLGCQECKGEGFISKLTPLDPFRRKWFAVLPEDLHRFKLYATHVFQSVTNDLRKMEQKDYTAFPMNDRACYNCPYAKGPCWEGDPMEWFDVPEERIEGFVIRPDYVDDMAAKMAAEEVI